MLSYIKKWFCSFLQKEQNLGKETMPHIAEDSNQVENNVYTGIQIKTTDATTLHNENVDSSHSNDSPFDEPHDYSERDIVDNVQYDDIVKKTNMTLTNGKYVVGLSMRGKSHIKDNKPCQDNHWFENIHEGWDLYVVSDGAGSAKHAERGSLANCKLISKLIRQLLEKNNWIKDNILPTELEWYIEMRSIFESMRLFYKSKVEELSDGSVIKDFNATALVLLVTPKGMMSAHIGDGRMGYKDWNNEWHPLMTPHKGEEANQTLFVTSNWDKPTIPSFKVSGLSIPEVMVENTLPQVVVIMSDGCEKATWECIMYDNTLGKYADKNLPFAGFLDPLVTSLDNVGEDRFSTLKEIISDGTEACSREQDDKTVLLGRY